jgi:hypothetical protein
MSAATILPMVAPSIGWRRQPHHAVLNRLGYRWKPGLSADAFLQSDFEPGGDADDRDAVGEVVFNRVWVGSVALDGVGRRLAGCPLPARGSLQ